MNFKERSHNLCAECMEINVNTAWVNTIFIKSYKMNEKRHIYAKKCNWYNNISSMSIGAVSTHTSSSYI